jgi:MFS family permease
VRVEDGVAGGRRRNRNLWLVEASWGCWVATDLALLVVLSVVGYAVGGVGAVGLVSAARVLPGALLGPLVVPLVDRFPRPRMLAASHVFGAVTSLLLAWAAVGDALWALVAVAAAGSLGGSLYKAVLRAAISQVVRSPAELVTANAAYAAIEGLGTVAGPLAAGALLVLVDPPAALAGLAVVYALGATASALVRTRYQVARRPATGRRWQGLRGFGVLLGPSLRRLFALFMAQCLMRGLLTVFVAALCLAPGGGGERRVAALFATLGAGGLVGAWVVGRSPGQGTAARRATAGVALWGAPVALLGAAPQPWLAWVALALVGLGNALEDVYGLSVLDRLLPGHLAARVYALFWSLAAAMVTAGSLLGPVLVSGLGLGPAMLMAGGALVLLCLLVLPGMRRLDRVVGAPPAHLDLVCAVPELSALPLMAAERLARELRPRALEDGEVVMREGARASGFAIVEEGVLEVRQAGRLVRTLGAGDSFGEVGLLLDRPRTATVTAVGPAAVLELDAHTFVAAVTGHRDAASAAHRVAQGHLRADAARRGDELTA